MVVMSVAVAVAMIVRVVVVGMAVVGGYVQRMWMVGVVRSMGVPVAMITMGGGVRRV
jgi:hypothetical protein